MYGQFQPEDVLRDGLPPLPATEIEPGMYSPIALWQDDRFAAVLYIHRLTPGTFDFPGDEYANETEHLVADADADGKWTSIGGGGGGWVNVFDPPRELLEKYVVLGTGVSGSGDGDEAVFFTGGLCSSAVAAVETVDVTGTRRYPIDPGRPFFVVGLRGSGRVRILDADGRVVHNQAISRWSSASTTDLASRQDESVRSGDAPCRSVSKPVRRWRTRKRAIGAGPPRAGRSVRRRRGNRSGIRVGCELAARSGAW